jgi:glycosyltransferase involved in cell wall biosynthesis
MRVLLVAFGCEPGFGSERETGWQWAITWARAAEVDVLTAATAGTVKSEFNRAGSNPHLIPVDVAWPKRMSVGGGYSHLKYLLWSVRASQVARRLLLNVKYDLVHHVSLSSVSMPPIATDARTPMVWGPVGGGQLAPWRYWRDFGSQGFRELVRNCRVITTSYNPILRRAARASTLCLASNYETARVLERMGARRVEVMPDSAVSVEWLDEVRPPCAEGRPPVVLWVSRLEPHKGLSLALKAFSVAIRSRPATLRIVGEGPLFGSAQVLARELGISEFVTFRGMQPRGEVRREMLSADLLLFTSLRESFGMPLVEAMATRLPIVTIDHQGAAQIPGSAAMKVPLLPPSEMAEALASSLNRLLASPSLRQRLGEGGRQWVAEEHTWSRHCARVLNALPGRDAATAVQSIGRYK